MQKKETVRQSLLESSAESIEKRYHKKNKNKDFLFVNLKTHNKNLARYQKKSNSKKSNFLGLKIAINICLICLVPMIGLVHGAYKKFKK